MFEILKIGKVLTTDSDGFIINDSHANKIISPWKEAVEEMMNKYLEHLGNTIHGIYVRGTVSRGEAVLGISDVDMYVVIKEKVEIDMIWKKETQKFLVEKFPFATGFDMRIITYDELFSDTNFRERFVLKTQSTCMYGEDVAQKIPPFRIDAHVVAELRHNINLEKVILDTKRNIIENNNTENIKKWCRWAMKRIVRAGFLLVMDKEQVFTRDLHPSYELFSKHFPEQEPQMKKALYLAINPTDSMDEIVDFLDDFGVWIEEKINEKLST